MVDILIWGLGKRSKIIIDSLNLNKCHLVGFIDRNKNNIRIEGKNWEVKKKEEINKITFNFIIVTTLDIIQIKEELKELQVPDKKVIYFWHEEILEYDFLNPYPKKYYLTKLKMKKFELQAKNAKYEYGEYVGPIIKPAEELLKIIIEEKKSLCRFGDGEFEIMLGRNRASFQKVNEGFSKKLLYVLHNTNPNVVVAVADNYGCLDKYTDTAADDIRAYLTEDVRNEHMRLLEKNRVYYDAYVSRAYMMYKDKKRSQKIFELYKALFKDRNIVLIEGNYTRTGYNNNLFESACSVRRILCPDSNCYNMYDEIYNSVIKIAKDNDLILITLGSVATILAYDLACLGYQAIDLGQLDNEYEWSLRGSQYKEAIEGKTVSDIVEDAHLDKIDKDESYESQIVLKIDFGSKETIKNEMDT